MMKRSTIFTILVLALMTTASAYAQRPGGGGRSAGATLSGTVVDSTAGTALSGATIALRNAADSSLVTGAIADRDGSFSVIGLAPGRYLLRASFVGYTTKWMRDITVDAHSGAMQLGTVALAPEGGKGDGVTVNGKREFMTIAIDRTIYKTSDLKVASGGNATDLLRNIPAIEVDADGNVSLRGSQSVVIQINGRPTMMNGASLATFLQSLPADAVERIEVIPNPSAKYDPDGLGGIINIVMKQGGDRGLSGGVNGAVGTDPNATFGANIGYGSGPWSIFANYGFNYERMYGETDRYRRSLIEGPAAQLQQNATDTTHTTGHTFNASVDYGLAPQQTLSLSTFFNHRNAPNNWLIGSAERTAGGELLRRYGRAFVDSSSGNSGEVRLGYKWTPEPTRRELSIEARGSMDKGESPNHYWLRTMNPDGSLVSSVENRRTFRDDENRSYSFQADYSQPLGEDNHFETGYKGEALRITGDYRTDLLDTLAGGFVPDAALANNSIYDRTIHAVYLIYGHDFGPLSVEAGLRAEKALTTFNLVSTNQTFDNDYFNLFPSVNIAYKPADELQMKLGYSRRIERPQTWQLNPFPDFDDPTFRSVGNPHLKPQYTDSYDFTMAYFFDGGSVSVSPYYRHITNEMGRWEYFDSTGMATLTWENLKTTDNYGADMVAMYRVGDWLSMFVAVGAYQYNFDATNLDAVSKKEAVIWSGRGSVSATLTEGLDLQVTYFYRAPMQIMGGEIGSFKSGDLALVQKLFDNKATVGLRLTDPLKQMGFDMDHTYSGFYENMNRAWNTRTLSLTFSYAFGTPDRNRPRNEGQGGGAPSGGFGM